MVVREWQKGFCPMCGDETLEIPIVGWESSVDVRDKKSNQGFSGIIVQGFWPKLDLDKATCTEGCRLTKKDLVDLEITDHMWDDGKK